MRDYIVPILGLIATILAGYTLTIKLEVPDEPIVINMNVKLQVEKAAEEVIESNPDIF